MTETSGTETTQEQTTLKFPLKLNFALNLTTLCETSLHEQVDDDDVNDDNDDEYKIDDDYY